MSIPILHTERLTLRLFELSDAVRLAALIGDRAISESTLNVPHPYEEVDALRWIPHGVSEYFNDRGARFAICRRDSGELMGGLGVHVDLGHQRAEIGYWMGVPYWGQGYCTEACRAAIEYGFTTLNLWRIYAYHFADNPASGRVMQKVGMTHEGTLRDHVWKDGRFITMEAYGILNPEYVEGRDGVQSA